MRCLRGPLYSMEAEVLRWEGITHSDSTTVDQSGDWETYQDPISFEILKRWVPGRSDDPSTLENETASFVTIPCMARGLIDGGIKLNPTGESFGDTYTNIDTVRLKVPAHVLLTKRDRITNIRESKGGKVLWKDEEGDGGATVFNVNGVVPVLDGFNRHIENFVFLERAD